MGERLRALAANACAAIGEQFLNAAANAVGIKKILLLYRADIWADRAEWCLGEESGAELARRRRRRWAALGRRVFHDNDHALHIFDEEAGRWRRAR